MHAYLIRCSNCGRTTSKKYARAHLGLCKSCFTHGQPQRSQADRDALVLAHEAYALEQCLYDLPVRVELRG